MTIKSGMSDCSSIKSDWEKLAQMAVVFASPQSFAWHLAKDLVFNGVEITKEISTAITDYENKNWKDFGYQCGKAAAQVMIGEESQAFLAQQQRQKAARTF